MRETDTKENRCGSWSVNQFIIVPSGRDFKFWFRRILGTLKNDGGILSKPQTRKMGPSIFWARAVLRFTPVPSCIFAQNSNSRWFFEILLKKFKLRLILRHFFRLIQRSFTLPRPSIPPQSRFRRAVVLKGKLKIRWKKLSCIPRPYMVYFSIKRGKKVKTCMEKMAIFGRFLLKFSIFRYFELVILVFFIKNDKTTDINHSARDLPLPINAVPFFLQIRGPWTLGTPQELGTKNANSWAKVPSWRFLTQLTWVYAPRDPKNQFRHNSGSYRIG